MYVRKMEHFKSVQWDSLTSTIGIKIRKLQNFLFLIPILLGKTRKSIMTFGMGKPSIKRSIKARTTGKVKRAVKKAVIPGYGKKGMG